MRGASDGSELFHGLGLRPFGALGDLKLDVVTLRERLESQSFNRGVVDEHIVPLLLRDEPIAGWVRRWYRYHPLPGSRARLLPPSPLRTTRASFPACRSSLANALLWTRFHYGKSLAMDLGMTVRVKQHAVFGTVGTAMRAPHEMMAMPSG